MPRPRNETPLPPHPAVAGELVTKRRYGHVSPCARVICPQCAKARWYSAGVLRQLLKRPNFTGACRKCWAARERDRSFRSKRNPDGRRLISTGYVVLSKNAISDGDLALFDAMRGRASHVLEHRWVMAKTMGRALRSNESVDHMNGVRHDNRAENLRLYVRGRNEPGSCPGSGTYYHEWQMADARVRKLEAMLAR